MKKKIFLSLMLLPMFFLSSCGNSIAKDFNSKPVDNGYNNYLAGGKMAFFDNDLYLVYNIQAAYSLGTYKINSKGSEKIFDNGDLMVGSSLDDKRLYQLNNQLYTLDYTSGDIQKYNNNENKLEKSNYNFTDDSNLFYLSDDLKVYVASSNDNGFTLGIMYKDNKQFTLDATVTDFYVYENTIYYINTDGWLYSFDVTNPNAKSEFISKLADGDNSFFTICNGYCYYDRRFDLEGTSLKAGIYRYSIDDDESEYMVNEEIKGYNSYNQFYFVSTNGVFCDDGKTTKKISNISADELYILDEDWIYTVDNNKGEIFRISLNGKTTEKIAFV